MRGVETTSLKIYILRKAKSKHPDLSCHAFFRRILLYGTKANKKFVINYDPDQNILFVVPLKKCFFCRVVVVDAQTFLIPNFTYDGQAPDAHFHVGRGARVGPEVEEVDI